MKFIGWIIAFLSCTSLMGQSRLVAGGTGTSLYVSYLVPGGQSLGSVADQFNVPLPALARFNTMNQNLELRKGEEVRIPLIRENFIQRNIFGKYQPVYHIVKTGDNLSRIAQRYNKIDIDTLKRWNSLADSVPEGKAITVGFISNNKVLPVTAAYQSIAYDTLPNPNVMDAAKFGPKTLTGELKPTKIPLPEPPAELPVVIVKAPPAAAPTNNIPANTTGTANKTDNNKNPNSPAPNNTLVSRKPALVAPTLVQTEGDFSYRPRSNDEGYFAYTYYQRVKDRAYQYLTGDAAIFKTISGGNDRKFYVLINEILPGTIVRIMAPNKKTICAKVLGPLPETKGAAGLIIRMSNSAAAALGMDDQRFLVSITYVEY
jgi:LysM repeat protein